MTIVTIHTAKTTLSQLIARAEAGEEIVIARGKQPVARLAPIKPVESKRESGAWKGQGHVGPEFFKPLPPEELGAQPAPVEPVTPGPRREPGRWEGLISHTDDAFDPMSDEELKEWGLL